MRILIVLAMVAVTIGAVYAYSLQHIPYDEKIWIQNPPNPNGSGVSLPNGPGKVYHNRPYFSMTAMGIAATWLIAVCLLTRVWIKRCRRST